VSGGCGLNYPEFPDSCPARLFGVAVDVADVLVDGPDIDFNERGHELLSEPDGFVLYADFDAALAGLQTEHEKLGRAVADVGVFSFRHGLLL